MAIVKFIVLKNELQYCLSSGVLPPSPSSITTMVHIHNKTTQKSNIVLGEGEMYGILDLQRKKRKGVPNILSNIAESTRSVYFCIHNQIIFSF